MDYTLSGGPISASWTMPPGPAPFVLEDGTAFAINSTNLIVGNRPVDDIICFFDLNDSDGLNTVASIPHVRGAQLCSGPEDSPAMPTGLIDPTDATGDSYTLNVIRAPESVTWLFLDPGLGTLAVTKREKLQAS